MWKARGKNAMQAALLIASVSAFAYAYFTGPDRGYTGAFGDIGDCTACHDTYLANTGAGTLAIGGNPAIYEPSQSYTLAISLQDPVARRWGFEMTALDSNGARAGSFAPLGSDTQIATKGAAIFNRQYIEHTASGTFPGTAGGHIWNVRWTAPASDVGAVRFFVAGNAANNNNQNSGDYIYTNSALSDSPTSSVTVSLTSPPDGMTLHAGSIFPITWSATNTANIQSFEVRYSADDGVTFPITNLVFSTVDTSITSFAWTVPDTPATRARLRVEASTSSGSAVSQISGRFTITAGTVGGSAPEITSATAQGKHLYVFGNNFEQGAVVMVNGQPERTRNRTDLSHQLYCKKGAKLIVPGQTVMLSVMNPDGTTSASFSFFRQS
jgi:hypothetical protein